jgi:hypothetical protein
MSEIVFECRRHGERTEDQVYRSNDKATLKGYRYKCKECTYMANAKRPCKVHGDISLTERLPSGHCILCSLSFMRDSNKKRDENRNEFNEVQRLKREANPELWEKKYKEKHRRNVELYGQESLTKRNKANRFKITVSDLQQMFIDQENKCAICNEKEIRIFTDRSTKQKKVASLCLDHCHKTGELRQLLCHDCNTMLGKAKDDIQILQSAIDYLKKHKDNPDATSSS